MGGVLWGFQGSFKGNVWTLWDDRDFSGIQACRVLDLVAFGALRIGKHHQGFKWPLWVLRSGYGRRVLLWFRVSVWGLGLEGLALFGDSK